MGLPRHAAGEVAARARLGFEIKRTDSPTLTRSMAIARDDLKLDALWVVYPGAASVALAPRILTLPVGRLWEELG